MENLLRSWVPLLGRRLSFDKFVGPGTFRLRTDSFNLVDTNTATATVLLPIPTDALVGSIVAVRRYPSTSNFTVKVEDGSSKVNWSASESVDSRLYLCFGAADGWGDF